jgi:hypothetical protein
LNLASTTKTAQSWSDCGEIIKICWSLLCYNSTKALISISIIIIC